MEKTYSQKIALLLGIISIVLLIPSLLGVFFACLIIAEVPVFTMVIWIVFIIGVTMLIGYFKHSSGNLDAEKVTILWVSTAIYNGIFGTFYLIFFASAVFDNSNSRGDRSIFFVILLAGLWCVAATVLPITALFSIKRNDNAR